jgi:hypothetical protein
MFRIRRLVFLDLHDTSVQYYGLKSSREMCKYTKEALPMFLWVCGAAQLFRKLKNKFSHSLETIIRKVKEAFESVMGLVLKLLSLKIHILVQYILSYKKLGFGLILKIALVQSMTHIYH